MTQIFRIQLQIAITILFCQTAVGQSILLKNINVIPMTSEIVLRKKDVKIENGIIVAIEPAGSKLKGDITINDPGLYLTPGLSEMHAHIPTPDESNHEENVKETLFLYLANGITTIRGMLGAPYHLKLKKQVEKLEFPTPRIYTSSPSLNGNTIPDKETAIEKVTQYAADGYDFLKIHPGIQIDVFDQIMQTADKVGIPHAGHVPADVGIRHAIESRYATIDHIDGYVEGLAPDDKRNEGGFFGILLGGLADTTLMDALIQSTKQQRIAIVPTQSLMTRWLAPSSPADLMREPEMAYISPSLRFSWRQNKEQLLERLNYSISTYEQFIHLRKMLLVEFQKAGVPILLGSDAPQVFNVPGFSIHHEIMALKEAGLSPYQILQAGTTNVADFYKARDRGTIQVGKIADAIITKGNPLEDLANLQKIEAVIYQGKLLTKKQIDSTLKEIEKKYKTE